MKTIKANIWGEQKEVQLCTWDEIKKLGFAKRDRNFGALNGGTPALFFCKEHNWYVTTEKLENIYD